MIRTTLTYTFNNIVPKLRAPHQKVVDIVGICFYSKRVNRALSVKYAGYRKYHELVNNDGSQGQ